MLPALALILALPAASAPGHALVIDIRHASAAEVESYRHAPGADWWIELGDSLVVGGAAAPLRALAAEAPLRGELAEVDRRDLALRAIGCNDEEPAPGRLLARGGRWQLRLLPAGGSLPAARAGHDEWRRVQAGGQVLARQYRLDAAARAAPDPLILPVVQRVDAARWFADVSQLASWDRSSYGSSGIAAARDWLGQQFQQLGLAVSQPSFTMQGPTGTISRQNVIGRWTGTRLPDEWIIVGAHYDSRNANGNSVSNTPGAEDNASGCAGVIELARALLPFKPRRSVLFMCYAGEEQGLLGSAAHVSALSSAGDLAKVKSVVIMDMIGYSADGTLDVLYESKALYQSFLDRFAAAAATYVPALNVTLSTNPFGSDHMPYLNAGKETLLAIESDWDVYPHYHSSTDTPANMGINAQAMGGAILKTNAAMLAQLSGADDRIFADGLQP
ncbi:M28 family metallopeptidase [Tahibacter harae]|uniref:M28 family peptidase n=1 Tax=Tahibacter harae TaxID=2963937 RepID=A0ABT1QL97_9GAMM|nr:M28 family peptidase [Tahibacter harae]MCQ4163298.1 M28 family peptidase [Tahibacter harae]